MSYGAPRPRACEALVSALLFFAAFRPLHFFPLAWIALVPLLRVTQGQPARDRFKSGLLFGFVAFAASFYWIPISIFNARWLLHFAPWSGALVAALAWVLTSLVFGLYCGLVMLTGLTARPAGASAPLRFACAWAAFEWLRTLGPLGFAWGALGLSQSPWTWLIQSCDVCGVHGLSFLMALANASLAMTMPSPVTTRWRLLSIALVIACYVHAVRVRPPPVTYAVQYMKALSIIQPAIPIREKVDAKRLDRNLLVLEQLSLEAARERPDLIIWPETMLPVAWTLQPEVQLRLRALAAACRTDLLIGTNEREQKSAPLYNQVVLLTPQGERGWTRKQRLVPFGEYVPLKAWIPPLRVLSPGDNDYSSGASRLLRTSKAGAVGVLVCFESTFAAEARRLVRMGADFLVVVTNDDWFVGTTAIADHTDSAVFRAIETRRWVLQAGNSGVSFFVAPTGEIVDRLPFAKRGVLTYTIDRESGQTLAVRYGDWVPLMSALALVLLAWRALGRGVAEDERTIG